MKFSRLGRGELVGTAGTVILIAALWLPWFTTNPDNENSSVDGKTGSLSAWDSFQYLPYMLILVAIPPLVLTYIVLRGHSLGWNRGEVTAIFGILAILLVLSNGIIFGRPGANPVEVSLSYGYAVAFLGAFGIFAGGVLRQAVSPPKPKPPGV